MIRVEPSLNVKTTLPSLPTIYGLSVLKNDVKLLFLALSELMISFLFALRNTIRITHCFQFLLAK